VINIHQYDQIVKLKFGNADYSLSCGKNHSHCTAKNPLEALQWVRVKAD